MIPRNVQLPFCLNFWEPTQHNHSLQLTFPVVLKCSNVSDFAVYDTLSFAEQLIKTYGKARVLN